MSHQRNTSILLLSLAVTSCAGFHSAALDEDVVITLERGSCYGPCPVERAHFFDLQDHYDSGLIDAPTFRVTYERHGQRKTVEESGGDGMPYVVRELEDEIDRVAQTGQWLHDSNPRHWPNVCAFW